MVHAGAQVRLKDKLFVFSEVSGGLHENIHSSTNNASLPCWFVQLENSFKLLSIGGFNAKQQGRNKDIRALILGHICHWVRNGC